MSVKLKEAVSWFMGSMQRSLFPRLEECWQRQLTEKERQLVSILELVEVERFVVRNATTQWLGRKLIEREAIARAFVAKAVYGHPFTRSVMEALRGNATLRRICGLENISDIPSEATFSRAFAEFAKTGLGDRVHEALVERCLRSELGGHISRDSTAIEGREKPRKKRKKPVCRKKRGRPRKDELSKKHTQSAPSRLTSSG
jgi:hypothetical protein